MGQSFSSGNKIVIYIDKPYCEFFRPGHSIADAPIADFYTAPARGYCLSWHQGLRWHHLCCVCDCRFTRRCHLWAGALELHSALQEHSAGPQGELAVAADYV